MSNNHAKRALKILRERGPVELVICISDFAGSRVQRLPPVYKVISLSYVNYFKNKRKYNFAPRPFEIIKMNANLIKKQKVFDVEETGLGKIVCGNWDHEDSMININSIWKVKGLKQRFEHNMSWKDTIYYEKYREIHGENKCQKKFKYIENLYNELKREGYKQRCFTNGRPVKLADWLEVCVNIGRDGKVYHQGRGHHRLALAQILDIDIYTHVVVRHEEWQKIRDRVFKNGFSGRYEGLRNHPDLQSIERPCG